MGKRFPAIIGISRSIVAPSSIGIIMNGVSGRMGYRQHLLRSILAIREQGGVLLSLIHI